MDYLPVFGPLIVSLLAISLSFRLFDYLPTTVDVDIFTVILFSLYSRLVNNREIKLTLIFQRQLQYYSISAAIVKIKYA